MDRSMVRARRVATFSLAAAFVGSAAASAQVAPERDVGVLGDAQPLLVTDYSVEVVGEGPAFQASAVVELRNPRLDAVEGVALIPLPRGAIARGFLAFNGDTRLNGVVRARDGAIDVYRGITRAPARGRDPAVLERLNDRWMRATVAPVAAQAAVKLTVGYLGLSEKLGDWREVDLPADASIHRASYLGSARRLLPSVPSAGPLATYCFRAPGGAGHFCMELDPAAQFGAPFERATYLLVLETPESTAGAIADAGGALLTSFVDELREGDAVELFANGCEDGCLGAVGAADVSARAKLAAALSSVTSGGWGHLESRLLRALSIAESRNGPVRVVVASAQRTIPHTADLVDAIVPLAYRRSDFALFTCALGARADDASLADLARAGHGRAFTLLAADETACVAPPLAAAVRHSVLLEPQVTVAGALDVVAERKRHLTFGETLRICGRYEEGMHTLARLEAWRGAGHPVDATYAAEFADEALAHPWVATLWAGFFADELRRHATAESPESSALDYLVRLEERFGLIGPETVALGLEPAFADRLPPLVGAPGLPVARLDPPERPLPPSNPEVPDRDDRERRLPPSGGPTLGPPPRPLAPPIASPRPPTSGPARGPSGRGR